MKDIHFTYQDDSELWLEDVISNHHEEALARTNSLLAQTEEDENGCWVSGTTQRPKVRFHGRQVAVARFVYCVLNREVLDQATVIRHRCHNELCCRPDHLVPGSVADNKRDDWVFWANGVDFDLL